MCASLPHWVNLWWCAYLGAISAKWGLIFQVLYWSEYKWIYDKLTFFAVCLWCTLFTSFLASQVHLTVQWHQPTWMQPAAVLTQWSPSPSIRLSRTRWDQKPRKAVSWTLWTWQVRLMGCIFFIFPSRESSFLMRTHTHTHTHMHTCTDTHIERKKNCTLNWLLEDAGKLWIYYQTEWLKLFCVLSVECK